MSKEFIGIYKIVGGEEDAGIGFWPSFHLADILMRRGWNTYNVENRSLESSALGAFRVAVEDRLGASTPRPIYFRVLLSVHPSPTSSWMAT